MPRPLHLSEPSEDDGELLYTVTVDRPTGPALIGIIVRDDDYTVVHWPDGETSWPVINQVALPAGDVSDVDAAYARALEALPEEVELVYVDHDDRLTDRQIQALFDGGAPYDDSEYDEWESDARFHGAVATINEYVDEGDIRILDTATEAISKYDELRFAVEERDTSDAFGGLLRQTPNKFMRYRIGVEWGSGWGESEDDVALAADAVCEALGLQPTKLGRAVDVVKSLLSEGQGGAVYVLWYGDVEPLVSACQNVDADSNLVPQTITWNKPALLILDHINGGGYDMAYPESITLPFKRENLKLDARGVGNGYSWSEEIAGGLNAGAYSTEVTITVNTNTAQEV